MNISRPCMLFVDNQREPGGVSWLRNIVAIQSWLQTADWRRTSPRHWQHRPASLVRVHHVPQPHQVSAQQYCTTLPSNIMYNTHCNYLAPSRYANYTHELMGLSVQFSSNNRWDHCECQLTSLAQLQLLYVAWWRAQVEFQLLHLSFLWQLHYQHAPLRVCSAVQRHQSAERPILPTDYDSKQHIVYIWGDVQETWRMSSEQCYLEYGSSKALYGP